MSANFSKQDTVSRKKTYILSAISGVIIALISMLIFSAILLFTGIDRSFAVPFATVSVAIGGFFASRYAAKKIGDKGYITGIVIGGITFAIITVLSFIFTKNGLSLNTLFHFIIIMLASVTGGIMGVNTNKPKKYI